MTRTRKKSAATASFTPAIYRKQVEPALHRKNNQSYQEAVTYLGKIHKLMTAMDKQAEFQVDLLTIKTEWKRLRNFIKYVERTEWGKWA